LKIKHCLAASALALTAGFAFASPSALASSSQCGDTDTDITDSSVAVDTPVIGVCAAGDPTSQSGHVWVDGAASNPDPLDGFASVSNNDPASKGDGVCANGDDGPADDNPADCVAIPAP